jgi:hypothetical protein
MQCGHDAAMRILFIPALFALAACGSPRDQKVGGVSQSEADALNDAAEMLDANTVVPVVVENVTAP